jgi:hypothetical protein
MKANGLLPEVVWKEPPASVWVLRVVQAAFFSLDAI